MSHDAFSVLGSGCTPYLYNHRVPLQDLSGTDDGSPEQLVWRKGEQVAVINYEDNSVHVSGVTRQVSVGTSATRIDVGLTFRRAVAIVNTNATDTLYVGFSPGVTTSNGFQLLPNTSLSIDATNILSIYGIAAATILVGVMECA